MQKLSAIVLWIMLLATVLGIHSTWATQSSAEEIKIIGSTTFAPLMASLTDRWTATNPAVRIAFTDGSAGESFSAILDGRVDIGCSARPLRLEEAEKAKAKGINLICRPVALDSIVPIVNPSNDIRSIGLLQLRGIFSGRQGDWAEMSEGKNKHDTPIRVVVRETGSAMNEFWDEKVMEGTSTVPGATTLRSNPDIVKLVAEDPLAIGYTSYSRLSSQVRVLPLNGYDTGAAPTEGHPLSRKLFLCTNEKPTGEIQRLMDFLGEPEGRELIRKAGFVPYP